MTPATIIKESQADGVSLTISPSGTIKATGDGAAVKRWLAVIREHKSGIVKTLLEQSALTGDLPAIRAWLSFIGETDPAIIDEVLDKCRADSDALDYFTRRAKEDSR